VPAITPFTLTGIVVVVGVLPLFPGPHASRVYVLVPAGYTVVDPASGKVAPSIITVPPSVCFTDQERVVGWLGLMELGLALKLSIDTRRP
jgi:hypothetical protein